MRRPNLTLIPRPDETGESMARRLQKVMLKEGLYKLMKARAFYEKPSVKKRRKQAAARKRRRKDFTKEGEHRGRLESESRHFGRG